ncbi:hypothetical protein [Nocardioides sp.]|jgi:hypothetical protein|uniref:hypothetical protein n=1 Tax=Nocardioides sp. TaxID=35761 RepID=UPI0031FE633C|nr:hypothetical protein [Nocardioides sp.]
MSLRVPAALAGLLGGACWVARAFADSEGLRWAGLALLGLALVATGAGLVKAAWLGLIVGVAFPVLIWSVLEVLHDSSGAEDVNVDAVAGGVVALVALAVLIRSAVRPRGRSSRDRDRRTSGSHAR